MKKHLKKTFYFDLKALNLGFYLIVFFFNLIITGWSIGFIVSGLVLRYGQSFEELAWAFIFLLLPFSLMDDAETKVLLFLSSIICADIFRDDLNTVNLNLSELIFLSFFLIFAALF